MKYKPKVFSCGLSVVTAVAASAAILSAVYPAQGADQKPNIVVIMGDDIGMWNIGAYHRGMMAGLNARLGKGALVKIFFTRPPSELKQTRLSPSPRANDDH